MKVRRKVREVSLRRLDADALRTELGWCRLPPAAAGNTLPPDDVPGWDDPRLVAEVAALGPSETVVLRLMRAGERGTDVFARALNLPEGSPAELAAVKRYKDRVKKRLARAVGGAA